MRSIEIEAWALRVLSAIKDYGHYEDSRVELKSIWPDPQKASRQIAGHANAARSNGILWVIGADEKKGLVGAEIKDLAVWYQQLKACFSEMCPQVVDLVIHYENKIFIALYFVTDRPPYLVKNPNFGQRSGGSIAYEVPWREGTTTRTANRTDLFTVLLPTVEQPRFEILESSLTTLGDDNRYYLSIGIYVIPQRDVIYVYPHHKTQCQMISETGMILESRDVRVTTKEIMRAFAGSILRREKSSPVVNVSTSDKTIEINESELIVRRPSTFVVRATLQSDIPFNLERSATVHFQLTSAYDDVVCALSASLTPSLSDEKEPCLILK